MLCIFCLACKYESDCPTENVSLLIEYIALIIADLICIIYYSEIPIS